MVNMKNMYEENVNVDNDFDENFYENAENELKRSIISGKARGLTKEQIFSLTEKIFNEENNND